MLVSALDSNHGASGAPSAHTGIAAASSAAAHGIVAALVFVALARDTTPPAEPVADDPHVVRLVAVPRNVDQRLPGGRPARLTTTQKVRSTAALDATTRLSDVFARAERPTAAPAAPVVVTGVFDSACATADHHARRSRRHRPLRPRRRDWRLRRASRHGRADRHVRERSDQRRGQRRRHGGAARPAARRASARYTDEAREGRVTGEVILEVRLTAAGVVHVLRVLSGLGYGLDESAVAAVRRSRCRPALRNGRPIDATGTVTVVFSLT